MVERPLCRRIAKVLDTPSSTKLKLKLARSNGLAGKITRGDGTVCGFIAHPLRVTRLCVVWLPYFSEGQVVWPVSSP